ncbi:unnamed protein product (macronuclear) [Paramecium tetraurelia]|uniref:TLDc domain-containing protein n=1 Tax=Paramecium tetraurelia TaxID=5888 RepID=A0CL47_PARTE|nr:uncharacterized protein GSPATT00008061001 [Paramecium tetraurelia]CAK71514.1 unnamed protein product [Paramecium tetraurelia]|eukprot:XP_001438911.1 hypothetical protein (macronuclear) [Paramecium tetraurelia strain d4-2]
MQTQDGEQEMCKLTHHNRTFICTNIECIQAKRFQLQCHKCLTLQHTNQKGIQKLKNTKTVRHLDDFTEIKDILNQLELKYQGRFNFLQEVQQKLFDFQKEQIQKIEKFPFHDLNFIKLAKSEVDTLIQMFANELGYHQRILNEAKQYNNLTQKSILELYIRNDEKFHNDIINKQKQVFDKVRSNLAKKGLDFQKMFTNQEEKIAQAEERIKKLENPYASNKLFKACLIIATLVIISNQFSILTSTNQTQNQKKESILIESEISQIKEQWSDFQQDNMIKIEEIKNTLDDKLTSEIEYLKLYNQKLKVEMLDLQKQFKEMLVFQNQTISLLSQELNLLKEQVSITQNQIQNFNGVNIQLVNQQKELNHKQDNKELIDRFDNYYHEMNDKLNSTFYEMRQYVDYRILLNKHFFNAQKYLLGNIKEDYPIVLLQGFTLYLDQYLNKSLTHEQIYNLSNSFSLTGIACFGGISLQKPTHFALMACDYAFEIFTVTTSREKARKSRSSKDLFWYFVPRISIGFAPNENVNLQLADNVDPEDPYRFSMWLDHSQGGRRIGNQTSLINTTEYKMALFAIE